MPHKPKHSRNRSHCLIQNRSFQRKKRRMFTGHKIYQLQSNGASYIPLNADSDSDRRVFHRSPHSHVVVRLTAHEENGMGGTLRWRWLLSRMRGLGGSLFFSFFSRDQFAHTCHSLGQNQSTVAQPAEMTVDERSLTSCV